MEFTYPLLFLLLIYLFLALFYSFPPHHCDRQTSCTFPHKDVHGLILGTREYVTLYSKRVFSDMMKGFEMRTLSWFIQAHPSVISRVLVNRRMREESLNLRRRCDDRSRGQRHEMLTLEMEGEHEPRTLTDSRGRKRQGTFLPRTSRKNRSLADPCISSKWDLFWPSDLKNEKKINLCCFKLPNFWKGVAQAVGSEYNG